MNKTSKGLAIASMIMGILAVLSLATIIFGIIFGSLAVIFAILSKGASKRFTSGARSGLITGGLSVLTAFIIIFYSYFNFLSNEAFRQQINTSYEKQYGISFEQYVNLLKDAVIVGDEESINKLYEVVY